MFQLIDLCKPFAFDSLRGIDLMFKLIIRVKQAMIYNFYSILKMGGKVCCESRQNNNNPFEVSKLQTVEGQQQPELSYAFPENVKYEVPCNINHIFSDIPEIKIEENLERGVKKQNSYYLVPYSVYYTGEWKNGRPHGVGDVVFQNGSVLKATYHKGKVIGNDCILIMDDGSYYRGNIQNNCFCGKGKFVQASGHIYEGNWENNLPHGYGVEKFSNGDIYEGLYVSGKKKDEKGIYKWGNHPEFFQYRGSFENEYMNGEGTLIKKDGSRISGIFRQGIIQDAIIRTKNYQYKGQVKNGVINGLGYINNIQNKTTFEGSFKDGVPHGFGTLTLENGQKKTGNWFKGFLIKDYKGLTDEEVEGCLALIQEQFQTKTYIQDALESINFRLKSNNYQNFVAELKNTDQVTKLTGQKYFVVGMGAKTMIIYQKI